MKWMTALLFSLAAVAALAQEIEIFPLKSSGIKNVSVKEHTLTGIVTPGASVDLPLKSGIRLHCNRAVLQLAPAAGGLVPRPSDFRLKLLGKDLRQYDYFGAPGKQPDEVIFSLNRVPEEITLIRFYIDIDRQYTGKAVALNFAKFSLEQLEKPDAFIPLRNSRMINCREASVKEPVFSGIPENARSSVLFNVPPELKDFVFSEIEIGIAMKKGKLDTADMECNPRTEKSSVFIKDTVISGDRFTFFPDKPVHGISYLFLYFNNAGKHTGKELSFQIRYIRLIP